MLIAALKEKLCFSPFFSASSNPRVVACRLGPKARDLPLVPSPGAWKSPVCTSKNPLDTR